MILNIEIIHASKYILFSFNKNLLIKFVHGTQFSYTMMFSNKRIYRFFIIIKHTTVASDKSGHLVQFSLSFIFFQNIEKSWWCSTICHHYVNQKHVQNQGIRNGTRMLISRYHCMRNGEEHLMNLAYIITILYNITKDYLPVELTA